MHPENARSAVKTTGWSIAAPGSHPFTVLTPSDSGLVKLPRELADFCCDAAGSDPSGIHSTRLKVHPDLAQLSILTTDRRSIERRHVHLA
jgi:hypothetical protein